MQTENRLLDDLARVAAGAVEGLAGLRHEIEDRLRDRVERLLRGMDLVDRDEFEAVKAMAARARAEQEALAARVAALEAAAGRPGPRARKASGDPAAEDGPAVGA